MNEPKRKKLNQVTGSRKRRAGCCGCKAYSYAVKDTCALRRKMEIRSVAMGTNFYGGAEWCERPTTTKQFIALMERENTK